MKSLGTGVCLMNNQYLCTVPFALSNDVGDLLNMAEKVAQKYDEAQNSGKISLKKQREQEKGKSMK